MATTKQPDSSPQIECGAEVRDRKRGGDRLIVVNTPPVSAANWDDTAGESLAETNPGYPATDRVAVAAPTEEVYEAYPAYAGWEAIPISRLKADGINWQAYPQSRLSFLCREVAQELSPETLLPSKNHLRRYKIPDDARLAAEMDRENDFYGVVHARITEDGNLRLMNGHKRTWAAMIAGFEAIPVIGRFVSELEATKKFADHHLQPPEEREDAYRGKRRELAIKRIQDRFGDQCEKIPYVPVP